MQYRENCCKTFSIVGSAIFFNSFTFPAMVAASLIYRVDVAIEVHCVWYDNLVPPNLPLMVLKEDFVAAG
jgi:hypothetical protein